MAQPTWAEVEEAAWLTDDSGRHHDGRLLTPAHNHDDNSNNGGPSTSSSSQHHPSHSIPAWHLNDQDVTDFGPTPVQLEREVRVVDCPDCGKPVLERFLSYHQQNCALVRDIIAGKVSASVLEGKRRKRALSLDSNGSGANASLAGGGGEGGGSLLGDGDLGPPRKRTKKQEKLAEAAARRKARLDAKEAKALKKKNRMSRGDPLDVDRQCGVLTEKGPCSRSLTCKSHSMGAKRAVPGRSRPYDELLLAWQKATNPAFVAKLREKERNMAQAALEREQEKARKMEARKKRLLSGGAGGSGAGGVGGAGGKKKGRQGEGGGKKKGSKDGSGLGGLGGKDGMGLGAGGAGGMDGHGGSLGPGGALDPDADMYVQGATEADVQLELEAVLEAIRAAAMAPRTMAIPLAVTGRNFGAGAFVHRAMRYRALRAAGPIF